MSEPFLEECWKQRTSGVIKTGQEWVDQGIGGQQLVLSGQFVKVPCILTKDPTDMTEEERIQFNIFSPFLIPVEPITIEKILLFLLLTRYAKDPQGRGQLKEIAIKYLDVIGDSMKALARSGAAHWSVAAMNTKVTLRVYKNLGLMTPDEAAGLEVWINAFVAGLAAKDIIGEIAGLGTMVFGGVKGLRETTPAALALKGQ